MAVTAVGEYIALDLRGPKPLPVVAIDISNIDLSESVLSVAADFPSFLAIMGWRVPVPTAPSSGQPRMGFAYLRLPLRSNVRCLHLA